MFEFDELSPVVRLNRLFAKGYRIDPIPDVIDAIWLSHLNGAPRLILYSDGMVVALDGSAAINPRDKDNRDRIFADDQDDAHSFEHFLTTITPPTRQQISKAFREKHVALWLHSAGWWATIIVASVLAASLLT